MNYISRIDLIHMMRDFCDHEHIEAPFVEKVNVGDIPGDMQEIYKKYVDYLKINGYIQIVR